MPGPSPVPTTDHVDFVVSQWRQHCPQHDVAAMQIVSRIFRYATLATRDAEQAFRAHGLQQGEFDLLATLYRGGPPHTLSPQQLIDALLLSSGAMTNRLDRLETAGLVTRSPNPEDRRGVRVALTEQGLARIQAAMGDYLPVLEQLISPLSDGDRQTLAALLRQLLAAHDQHSPGALRP
ncbi:Transcriptional regulator, MarR family [plant metagenome]|uniref:Transcriptional regulator, MarR family n=1 Tax=plant metagenome TaxID=1297885 RepID=A0A484PUF0_9ZZZZ